MQAKTQNLVRAFLLVAVVAILATVPASAQVSFNVTSSAQTVRTEGQTETAGSVNMNWASGAAISAGSSITLTYASAAVTSVGVVTAKLAGTACTVGTTCAGMTAISSGASVIISFTAQTPATAFAAGDFIQVAQVRLNVAGFTGAQLVTGTTNLNATISGSSPSVNTVTFNQSQVQVAFIQNSLNVKISGAAPAVTTCLVATGTFTVSVAEVFPAALTSAADEALFTPSLAPAPTASTVNVVISNVPNGLAITPGAVTGGVTVVATPAAQTSAGVGTPLTFTYTVATTLPSTVETSLFAFTVGIPAGVAGTTVPTLAAASLASPQAIAAQVYLGPVTNTAATIVRFTQLNYPASAFTVASVSDCVTNLLFPYVTSDLGFDTSIQIANTSLDAPALGTQTAAKQQGTCKFTIYPTNATTGAIGTTLNSYVTPTIASGGSFQVLLSKTPYAKLSGYMFATCNFLNAHAFSYFVGPSSNGGLLTQGALALVVFPARVAGAAETLSQ